MNILLSALGRYEAVGNPADADCIIGHSFGTLTGEGSANRALANFIVENSNERPIIADRMLVDAFPQPSTVAKIVEGSISDAVGSGVGSWGTLVSALEFMEENELNRPLMVAQAHHIGRVVMQAKKLGMESIVPAGLPEQFDPGSDQLWTRSLGFWVPREIIGSAVLKLQGKL